MFLVVDARLYDDSLSDMLIKYNGSNNTFFVKMLEIVYSFDEQYIKVSTNTFHNTRAINILLLYETAYPEKSIILMMCVRVFMRQKQKQNKKVISFDDVS